METYSYVHDKRIMQHMFMNARVHMGLPVHCMPSKLTMTIWDGWRLAVPPFIGYHWIPIISPQPYHHISPENQRVTEQ